MGDQKQLIKILTGPFLMKLMLIVVAGIVRSGKWGNPDCGDIVEAFEKEFAAFCGAKYALTCVNGSVALRLAFIASGLNQAMKLLFHPTLLLLQLQSSLKQIVFLYLWTLILTPIILSAFKLRGRLQNGQKRLFRYILPVGLRYGYDNGYREKYNLRVIEDAAHGHGAEYKGKKLGSIGDADASVFSHRKTSPVAEGGMVITNDEGLYDMMNSLRNVGRVKGGQWYEHHHAWL